MAQNRTDRALIGLALLIVLISGVLLYNEDLLNRLLRLDSGDSTKPIVGEVESLINDARHRNSQSLTFTRARTQQNVRVGDALFTGERSKARVALSRGGYVDLDANTLVVFSELMGDRYADLNLGNVTMRVQGKMKFAVKGQIAEIEGDGSVVEISARQGPAPSIKLISGFATVRRANGDPVRLERGEVQVVDLGSRAAAPLPSPPPAKAPEVATVTAVTRTDPITYFFRVSDLYQDAGGVPVQRPRPTLVPKPVEVEWRATGQAAKFFGEFSGTADFTDPTLFSSESGSVVFDRVYLGTNHWRVSNDQMNWSTASFQVDGRFIPLDPPYLRLNRDVLDYSGHPVRTRLRLRNADLFPASIVEISTSPDFDPDRTWRQWVDGAVTHLTFNEPGRYFMRLRGITADRELTRFSPPQTLLVRLRDVAPVTPVPRGPVKEVPPLANRSKPAAQSQPDTPARTPAQVATSRFSPADIPPRYRNRMYNSSKFEVEGAGFFLYSTEYLETGSTEPPLAFLLGLRTHLWREQNGLEGSFKTKTIAVNDSGKSVRPLQLEARYLRRWLMRFNPFSSLKQAHIASILGFELYRNGGSDLYSSGYDLFKMGMALSFPAFYSWDTGGEILVGTNFATDRKYEISGHVHYYLKPKWSLGAGYRLHLFESGSTASAPGPLPYREGYGEGYSVMRWHY